MVDDDTTVRRVVRTVLESAGYDVVEADEGQAALDRLDTGGSLVAAVVDVMMPGIDGVELCQRIDTDTIRVLMLTAVDDEPTREACRAAGARHFLTKPFSSIELLDAVEALADGHDG